MADLKDRLKAKKAQHEVPANEQDGAVQQPMQADPYGQAVEESAAPVGTVEGPKTPKPTPETAKGAKTGGKDSKCPISLEDFQEHAKPLEVKIGDKTVTLDTKEFSSGSFGWYNNEKVQIEVGGIKVRVQCNMSLVVVGSKELAKG